MPSSNMQCIVLVEDNSADVFLVRTALDEAGIVFELYVFVDKVADYFRKPDDFDEFMRLGDLVKSLLDRQVTEARS